MNQAVGKATVIRFSTSGISRVPFRRGMKNHLLLDAVASDGTTLTFVLDTGATCSVVTPGFVATGLPRRLDVAVAASAVGAGGALPGTPECFELHDLTIGDLILERVGAVSLDLAGLDQQMGVEIHGIIGLNALAPMITLIDHATDTVEFHAPEHAATGWTLREPAHVIPFRLSRCGLVELAGCVNASPPIPFVFDTGSPYTILNASAAQSSGVAFAMESQNALAKGCGLGGGIPIEAGTAEALRFGTMAFDRPKLYTSDLPVFAALGMGASSGGVLGNDLLRGHRVALDCRASELLLWSP